MKILAIFPGHNACVCILENGNVLLNWELERFTRIRHDYGFRRDFILASLDHCRLDIADIDLLVVNRGLIDSGPFREGTVLRPFDIPNTREALFVCFRTKFMGRDFEALAINHHLGHAACAFFTSPFDEAAVLTYDGYGDGENASFSMGRGNTLHDFWKGHFSDLAGWWASVGVNNYRMPRLHEWDPGSYAGKVMALAAYGRHDASLLCALECDMRDAKRREHYPNPNYYAFNDAEDLSDTRTDRSRDFARALQAKTEFDISVLFSEIAQHHTPARNLCFAGGIALNCIANSVALEKSSFERLHVPPCPNDSGLALGMALYAYHQHFGCARKARHFVPYTGPSYPTAGGAFFALSQLHGVEIRPFSVDAVVNILCQREVIAFFIDRSECGPRALGNRSLLCLPDRANCRNFLNFEVKKREWYRPYAPIVLFEAANEVLEDCPEHSYYMTTSARLRAGWRERLAGVDHFDHSTRPQILKKEHHALLHEILSLVHQRTGIPVLLNTSFNLHEPIVETPEDAFKTFRAMPLRFLVTSDWIVDKRS
jgi:carbamoyltransferase